MGESELACATKSHRISNWIKCRFSRNPSLQTAFSGSLPTSELFWELLILTLTIQCFAPFSFMLGPETGWDINPSSHG